MITKPDSVAVINVNPGMLTTSFATSAFRMWQHDLRHNKLIGDMAFAKFGPDLTVARNSVVQTFLEGPFEWLLQIDSDMGFPENALDRLAAHTVGPDGTERHILGVVCPILKGAVIVPVPDDPTKPAIRASRSGVSVVANAFWWQTTPEGRRVVVTTNKPPNPENSAVLPCDGIGAAFLLVHRSVFEKMRKEQKYPYWFGPIYMDEDHASEDLGFCMRAKECGFTTWAVSRIEVRHEKSVMLDMPRW